MLSRKHLVALLAFAAMPLWSQVDSSGAQPATEGGAFWSGVSSSDVDQNGDAEPMTTPAPFSDEGYSLAFAGETPRSNYVSGGLSFDTIYDDNILPSSGRAVSDVRYGLWPSLSLQQSRSRVGWDLNYSPGFTFYQHNGAVNEIDHALALGVNYRFSPHVTLSFADTFRKTSDLLGLPQEGVSVPAPGGLHGPNDSIVPPATARISSYTDVQMTYQFAENAMLGVKGSLAGLWYPTRYNLPGLYDSTSRSGDAFYTQRLSRKHYIGATYGYQDLFTRPGQGQTQTHSTLLFYSLALPTLSVSLFAGPERSDSEGGPARPIHKWSPATGATVNWHGQRSSFLVSYARRVSDGGGLSGAVRFDRADVSARWQLARTMIAGIGVSYAANNVLDSQAIFGAGGHTWLETASFQHPLGENLVLQMGYTHLYQSYGSIETISKAPNRNNVWVSLSYQFQRPLGR
jgi:hypothetical protein